MRVMRIVPVGAYVLGLAIGCAVLVGGCNSGADNTATTTSTTPDPKYQDPNLKKGMQEAYKASMPKKSRPR